MFSSSTRWAPALTVLVAAPWFAEMSWGGYPFTDILVILLFLAPMYGCAALLIREVTRRTGRGWPTLLLLAAAFGVFQAGVVDQSLFNPAYGRYDFQHPVHVGGIDISLYYLLAFVSGHVVASIAAPIVIAEGWSRRTTEPRLGRRGLWVVAGVYALATIVNHLGVKDEEGHGFQASTLQVLVALATVLVLIGAALRWRRRPATATPVPAPWLLAVVGFVAHLLYLPGEDARAFVVAVAVIVVAIGVLGTWSRSRLWSGNHTLALAMGSVLVGMVIPFWTDPYDDTVGTKRELTADIAAASICLTIVAATALRHRVKKAQVTSGP